MWDKIVKGVYVNRIMISYLRFELGKLRYNSEQYDQICFDLMHSCGGKNSRGFLIPMNKARPPPLV